MNFSSQNFGKVFELIELNDVENLKIFFENCQDHINLEEIDYYGNTPLLKSCYLGYTGMAKLLINFGANLNVINYFGQNALTLATYSGSIDIIDILLKYRSYADFKLSSMIPSICVAAMCHNFDIFKKFSMNESNPWEVTTVHGLTAQELYSMEYFRACGVFENN